MRASQSAYLEWLDYMDEAQIKDLRTEIAYGLECPVCGGSGTIDSGRVDPEHGTSSLETCPLCGPIYIAKCAGTEPAPF